MVLVVQNVKTPHNYTTGTGATLVARSIFSTQSSNPGRRRSERHHPSCSNEFYKRATNRVISFVATTMSREHLITLSDTLIGVPTDNGGLRLYTLLADLSERDVVGLIAATGRRASAPLQRHAVSPVKARMTTYHQSERVD
jgi:hypothetical protein